MRMKVSKNRRIYYQGRDRTEGEIIDVPIKEAKLLKHLGKAEDAEHERPLRVAEPKPPVVSKALAAEPAPQPTRPRNLPTWENSPDVGDASPRHRYRRSDMKSDE